MGAILPFASKQQAGETPVEAAWRVYSELATQQLDNPALATNLEHSMAAARAWARWRDLFLAEDAA